MQINRDDVHQRLNRLEKENGRLKKLLMTVVVLVACLQIIDRSALFGPTPANAQRTAKPVGRFSTIYANRIVVTNPKTGKMSHLLGTREKMRVIKGGLGTDAKKIRRDEWLYPGPYFTIYGTDGSVRLRLGQNSDDGGVFTVKTSRQPGSFAQLSVNEAGSSFSLENLTKNSTTSMRANSRYAQVFAGSGFHGPPNVSAITLQASPGSDSPYTFVRYGTQQRKNGKTLSSVRYWPFNPPK